MNTVTVNPGNHKIKAAKGLLLKEVLAARQLMPGGFLCGGTGVCGRCLVHLKYKGQEGPIPVRACQTRVTEDIEVILDNRHGSVDILVTCNVPPAPFEPVVGKHLVPIREIAEGRDAWSTISGFLEANSAGNWTITLDALRQLALLESTGPQAVAVVAYFNQVIAVERDEAIERLYGMAFDVGTTTIVGYLYELTTGVHLATVSCLNAQAAYGADVISRIAAAECGPAEQNELQAAVVGSVNRLIDEACAKGDINPGDIFDLVMVGNTCMHHLFFGICPDSLGRAPYKPVCRGATTEDAARFGIAVNSAARVHWLPGVAGFVGADTVAMLLAHTPATDGKIRLAVDIGTNGEIVLSAKGKLWACSAAAGPAFEGVAISQGTRAVNGAIDHVFFAANGDFDYTTINGEKAVGICGSGIVDAIAAMLRCGLISRLGAIIKSGNRLLDSRRAPRDGECAIRIARTGPADTVSITQGDIRQLQLAKAAIRAGIDYLLQSAGVLARDVDEVLLAGAFGNYVTPESAIAIGLFPADFSGKIRPIGNAAGAGAQAALLSRSKRASADIIAGQVEYVELAGRTDYQNYYIDAILLGNQSEELK